MSVMGWREARHQEPKWAVRRVFCACGHEGDFVAEGHSIAEVEGKVEALQADASFEGHSVPDTVSVRHYYHPALAIDHLVKDEQKHADMLELMECGKEDFSVPADLLEGLYDAVDCVNARPMETYADNKHVPWERRHELETEVKA